MKSFFQNIGQRLRSFMSGRNGMDQLAFASFIVGLVFQVLGSLFGVGLLMILSLAAEVYAIFRIFSRKSYKREAENEQFVAWWSETSTKIRQFFRRLKLSRQYKYFKCPQCKTLLRLNRGEGEKEVCCPKCQHRFRQKS